MKVLITDDHELFTEGMELVLKSLDSELETTVAKNANAALAAIEETPDLDLILLDLSMPGIDGISFLQSLRARKLGIPVVVVSATDDINQIKTALDAGAFGFIPKAFNKNQLLDAIGKVLAGEIFLPASVQASLERISGQKKSNELPSKAEELGITARQLEVLGLIAKGYTNNQIATTLFLSEHTVKFHLRALFKSLNANNRTECVIAAEQKGLIGSPSAV